MVVWSLIIETDKKVMSLPALSEGYSVPRFVLRCACGIYLYSWRGVRGPRPVSAEGRYDLVLDSARGFVQWKSVEVVIWIMEARERERERERERDLGLGCESSPQEFGARTMDFEVAQSCSN